MKLLICVLLSVIIIIKTITAGGVYECNTDKDCAATATCKNSLCECPERHIFSKDGSTCLELAKKLNGKCEIDEQCAIFSGDVECRDEVCQCKIGSVYFRQRCIPREGNDGACTSDEQCFDGMDYFSRVCENKKCKCAPGYYNRGGVDCRKAAALGELCHMNQDCQDEGATCVDKICIDNTKNVTYQSFVEPECHKTLTISQKPQLPKTDGIALNAACTPGDTCADAHALCSPITRACSCRPGYAEIRANDGTRSCHAELGMTCASNEECVPGATCTNHICTCLPDKHYNAANSKCRFTAYLHDGKNFACNNADSCKALITNYYCDPTEEVKQCRCKSGYTINNLNICEVSSCSKDADCDKEHQVCSKDSECVCDAAYALIGGRCKPRVGGACKTDDECQSVVANSHCDKKQAVCVCNAKLVEYDFDCLPEIEIGSQCMYTEQCLWKTNSSCQASVDGNTCKCDDGFKDVNGNCLRVANKIGDYCTHPAVCMTNTRCQKSKCTCDKGLKPSKDLRLCLEPSNSAHTQPTPLTTAVYIVALLFMYFG